MYIFIFNIHTQLNFIDKFLSNFNQLANEGGTLWSRQVFEVKTPVSGG